jgi:hypothetical protein
MRRLCLVLASLLLLFLLVLPVTSQAQFASGHVFLFDAVWNDSDILEYTATGDFVRSFRAETGADPFDGPFFLRWGPDGHLYHYGRNVATDEVGVFEWAQTPGGLTLTFHNNPSQFEAWGFAVLDNGNWIIPLTDASGERLDEHERDFSNSWGYTLGQGGGLQGTYIHGGHAYIVGAGSLSRFDTLSRTEDLFVDTLYDNSDLAISPAGIVAVNNQWHLPPISSADILKFYDSDLNYLGMVEAPFLSWAWDRGLVFDAAGFLYVMTRDDATNTPWVTVFDDQRNLRGLWSPIGLRQAGGIQVLGTPNLRVTEVPEPSSAALLAMGALLAALSLRRRR